MKNPFFDRSTFDRLSQKVTDVATQPWFFWMIVAMLLAWVPTLWLWETGFSDLLIDSLTNPVSLILLVLLQNSQSRQESALDRRLDTLEHSLATLLQQVSRDVDDSTQRDMLCTAAQNLIDDARKSTQEASAGKRTTRKD